MTMLKMHAPVMRMARLTLLSVVTLVALPACDREDPTAIGGPLVESGVVRTFEITLDASQFLVRDTSFAAFEPPATIPFLILANAYEGALNANALARYRVDPFLGVVDAAGALKVDSAPKLQRGRIVLKLDTVASAYTAPVRLNLYEAGQAWDTATVTWTLASASTPWTTPGGTRGALLDSATFTGGDSVTFRVDTLTLARWRNPLVVNNGVLITVETPGTRLRLPKPILKIDYRSTLADTVVTQLLLPFAARFISDPPTPFAAADPRVGGAPLAYRAVLEVRPDLANVLVPCPFTTSCTVRLKDATIARADLLLEPVASPLGFAPELPVTILAYTLLPTPQLPLVRSPLGQPAGFQTVAPSSFRGTGAPVAALTLTTFVRELVSPIDTTTFNSRYIALLQGGTSTFGYATFRGQPRLRLRLSVAREIQLP